MSVCPCVYSRVSLGNKYHYSVEGGGPCVAGRNMCVGEHVCVICGVSNTYHLIDTSSVWFNSREEAEPMQLRVSEKVNI